MIKRKVIESFRKKIQERNADSTFTNQDLYNVLIEQASWLVKREISAGRIYRNTSFFQVLPAREVIETSTIPSCLKLKTNCKIYRTKDKLPEMWQDNNGPVIKTVNSIDNSTGFTLITPTAWQNKINNPYQRLSSEKYCFPSEGYIWFPKHNPHKININAFFKDDVRLLPDSCTECDNELTEDCLKALDTEFLVPDWILSELYSKALQQLFPAKQMQEDQQIDKNSTRKN